MNKATIGFLFLLAACTTSTTPTTTVATTTTQPTPTTTAPVVLPPQPLCGAYRGTGELDGISLTVYCQMGLQLVETVDSCEETGQRPDHCLAWATAPESAGGAGITGLSESELDLAFRIGRHHLNRLDAWEDSFEDCVTEHGGVACADAITIERDYPYP